MNPMRHVPRDVDARLRLAVAMRLEPGNVSPSGTWFAWRPVRLETGRWAWFRRVKWFRPLGLLTEYRGK